MQRLSEAVDLDRMFQAMQTAADRRAALIARYGWSDNVTCAECGDLGVPPVGGGFCCACDYGRERRSLLEREQAWLRTVPRRLSGFTLSSAPDQQAAAHVRAWLERRPWSTGENFLITGPPGTGKTGLAYAALRVACTMTRSGGTSDQSTRYVNVYAVNVAEWLLLMRPSDDPNRQAEQEEAHVRCRRTPLLLLDDLGAERESDATIERMYALLNERYDDLSPTIITSNYSSREMRSVYGDRVVDRLLERADGIGMKGGNLRRN